ncbi:hypothetical protein BH24PSE1_BH24PSE1_01920 [soil metagenome]
MAEEEPILTHPPTAEDARHVQDYSRFIALFKWGAIISFIVAIFVLFLIA